MGETGNRRKIEINWTLMGWSEIERFAIVSSSRVNSDEEHESWVKFPWEVED